MLWQIKLLTDKIKKLEESKSRRIPFNLSAGLEDLAGELIALLAESDLQLEHEKNVLRLVAKLRESGRKYNPDLPLDEQIKDVNADVLKKTAGL